MTILHRRPQRLSRLLGLLVLSYTLHSPGLERWFYVSQNLWVDQNVTNVLALMQRAAQAGYTHMLVNDSKFSRLATMDAHYFNNINLIKQAATNLNLEIVPTIFPIGYSNDILFNDPNLIEAMPVTNALLVISNGFALIQPDPPVAFPGGDFSNLSLWTWKDSTVVADSGTARVTNPNGVNARIVQTLTVKPFREYHISVQVKATNFVVAPLVEVIGSDGLVLNYNNLGVQPTQGWTTHHAVFNSLTNTTVNVYFGVWGGTTGSLWWDNAVIEEVAFLNLVRRPGAPLSVNAEGGAPLVEGTDFNMLTDPLMGTVPYAGVYDVYHIPPQLHILAPGLTNGTQLRASWSHAVTVYDGQANICVSEPATLNLLATKPSACKRPGAHAAISCRTTKSASSTGVPPVRRAGWMPGRCWRIMSALAPAYCAESIPAAVFTSGAICSILTTMHMPIIISPAETSPTHGRGSTATSLSCPGITINARLRCNSSLISAIASSSLATTIRRRRSLPIGSMPPALIPVFAASCTRPGRIITPISKRLNNSWRTIQPRASG